MKKKQFIPAFFINLFLGIQLVFAFGQSNGKITGKIINSEGEPIPGANIVVKETMQGTITNSGGSYMLDGIQPGSLTLKASFIGYKTAEKQIIWSGDTPLELNFILQPKDEQLEDILVTAGRIRERVDEVPVSSKVIVGKQLEIQLQANSNMNQVLGFAVPSMAPSTETASNWGQTLRGRQVVVLSDGIPQSTPLRNGQLGVRSIDGDVLERIEVINGATSIYGGGTGGGIINYITKKPGKEKLASITRVSMEGSAVEFSESMGYEIHQTLIGTAIKWAYLVNLGYAQTGTHYDNEGDVLPPTCGLGNNKDYNLFGKLGYRFSSDARLEATVSRYSNRQHTEYIAVNGKQTYTNGVYYLEKGYGEKGEVLNDADPGPVLTNLNLSYNHENIIGNSNLAVNGYCQKTDNIFFYSPTFENGGQSRILSKKLGIRPFLQSGIDLNSLGDLHLIYGADFLRDVTSQPLVDNRIWVPEIELQVVAPFLESRLNIAGDWVIKAGVRYDRMNIQVDDYSTLPYSLKGDSNFNPSVDVTGGELDYESVTFNAGVRYIHDHCFSPFFSFSQGFVLPDMGSILRSAQTDNIANIFLDPITTNSYEIGFSSRFDKVKFEAVGYYNTSERGAALVFNEDNNRFETARSPQQIFGYELSVNIRPWKKLTAGLAYSYVEGVAENEDGTLKYLPGHMIAAPKLTAFVTYQPTDKLSLQLHYMGVGDCDRFEPLENGLYAYGSSPVAGYNLINLIAGYQLSQAVGLSLAFNNLFNADYFPARSQWSAPLNNFI